jgi:hypothetical protein
LNRELLMGLWIEMCVSTIHDRRAGTMQAAAKDLGLPKPIKIANIYNIINIFPLLDIIISYIGTKNNSILKIKEYFIPRDGENKKSPKTARKPCHSESPKISPVPKILQKPLTNKDLHSIM